MSHATPTELVEPTAHARKIDLAVKAWLSGYKNPGTRRCYQGDIADFIGWCSRHGIDPVGVSRTHVDLWARDMEARELAASTVSRRITAAHMWFRFLVAEEVIERDPTVLVTRPRAPKDSRRPWLSRTELHDYLAAAEGIGGYTHALVCLLVFNGLRIGETCATDVSDMGEDHWYQTLRVWGKGDKPAVVPLPPRTVAAVYAALDGRTEGPLLLSQGGGRMTKSSARRAVLAVAKAAGINKQLSPHSLRHSAITAALNSGASLRDVQGFARHADPKTTLLYDRSRRDLSQHPCYAVMQYVSGAS